jgi:uncharacterized membrane protein YdbT with pleckstrin-like domain
MSYIDEQLTPEEKVVYRTKLHWILFVAPAIQLPVFLLIGLLSRHTWIILFALLAGVILAGRYVLYRTAEFAITNKRVPIKVGLLRRRSLELLLSKVEALGVDQSLLGRMLNYGTLTIGGTGGTQEVFPQIEAPLDFRRNVQLSLKINP